MPKYGGRWPLEDWLVYSNNKEKTVEEEFEPKIIAFMCNWCTYGAADLAGVSRLSYPPNIRPIRVMCSATVSPHHILRALQDGADGVLVGG
jgi:F420-non-reducing hydrogenase iron-sulfur subunit